MWLAVANYLLVEANNPIEAVELEGQEIMGCSYRSDLMIVKLFQQTVNALLGRNIETGFRFIQEKDCGFLSQSACDEDTLQLPPGQLSDGTVGDSCQIDFLESVSYFVVIGRARVMANTHARSTAQHHYLVDGDRELPVNGFELGDIANLLLAAPCPARSTAKDADAA